MTRASNCRKCGRAMRPAHATLTDYPGTIRHYGRGLCNACYRRHHDEFDRLKRPGDELLADVDALDTTPHEAARRLGVTVHAIARAARRHGRVDIARRFERAAALTREVCAA